MKRGMTGDAKLHFRCTRCGAINRIPADRLYDGPKCGKCGAKVEPAAAPADVDDAGLRATIAAAPVPVLVDFWAPWCGPCRTLAPHVEGLAVRHAGKLIVVKLNTQDHRGFAGELGISSIPTLCVFNNGELVNRQIGAVFGRDLDRVVEPFL
jgi:thioredoxin 2